MPSSSSWFLRIRAKFENADPPQASESQRGSSIVSSGGGGSRPLSAGGGGSRPLSAGGGGSRSLDTSPRSLNTSPNRRSQFRLGRSSISAAVGGSRGFRSSDTSPGRPPSRLGRSQSGGRHNLVLGATPAPSMSPSPPRSSRWNIRNRGRESGTNRESHSSGGTNREANVLIYQGIYANDLDMVKKAIEMDGEIIRRPLNHCGDKALHLASIMGHSTIVKHLLRVLDVSECEAFDGKGLTPFCYSAFSGNLDVARILYEANPTILFKASMQGQTPLYLATIHFKGAIVDFILSHVTETDLSLEQWFPIVITSTTTNMFEWALAILKKMSATNSASLLKMKDVGGRTVLHYLALKPAKEVYVDCWSDLLDCVWQTMTKFDLSDLHIAISDPNWPVIIEAAINNNIRFILKLVNTLPELFWQEDIRGRTIFHVAVEHRRHEIFSWILDIGCMKEMVTGKKDSDGNTLLHLAAKLPHPFVVENLDVEPIYQLKFDLDFYEDVKSVLQENLSEVENDIGLLPWDLFLSEHEDMIQRSRSHIKSISKSCGFIYVMITPLAYGGIVSEFGTSMSGTRMVKELINGTGIAIHFSLICLVAFWLLQSMWYVHRDFSTRVPLAYVFGVMMFFLSIFAMVKLRENIIFGFIGHRVVRF